MKDTFPDTEPSQFGKTKILPYLHWCRETKDGGILPLLYRCSSEVYARLPKNPAPGDRFEIDGVTYVAVAMLDILKSAPPRGTGL